MKFLKVKIVNSTDLQSLHDPFPYNGRQMDKEKCILVLLCPKARMVKYHDWLLYFFVLLYFFFLHVFGCYLFISTHHHQFYNLNILMFSHFPWAARTGSSPLSWNKYIEMQSCRSHSRDMDYHLNFEGPNPGEEDQEKVMRTTLGKLSGGLGIFH